MDLIYGTLTKSKFNFLTSVFFLAANLGVWREEEDDIVPPW